jgi:hypothetical protein
VRNNVTIDWTLRENVRAQLRVLVKRILMSQSSSTSSRRSAAVRLKSSSRRASVVMDTSLPPTP